MGLVKTALRSSRFVIGFRGRWPTASFSTSSDDSAFDTLVVGGGVVGSALACGLATSPMLKGCKIGIVENMAPKPFEDVVNAELPDLRVFAISPANIDFFKVSRNTMRLSCH